MSGIKCYPRRLLRSLNICFLIRTHEVQPAKTVQEFRFRRSYFSKKSKRNNHLSVSDILLLFIIYLRWCREVQSRSQSPRSSVGGIVGLWENAKENQPFIGCLIISLTHSLLIEICAILIIQKA